MSEFSDLIPSQDAEDLATFGDPVIYTPLVGDPQTLPMVDRPPATMDPVDIPRHVIRWAPASSFLVTPAPGCTMTVDDVVYDVFEILRDEFDGLFLIANR